MRNVFLIIVCLLSLQREAPADRQHEWVVRDVTLVADCDGTTQRYVVMLPQGFKTGRSHDVLIALHGHGSDRWQFVKDSRDECRAARDVAMYATP